MAFVLQEDIKVAEQSEGLNETKVKTKMECVNKVHYCCSCQLESIANSQMLAPLHLNQPSMNPTLAGPAKLRSSTGDMIDIHQGMTALKLSMGMSNGNTV